MPGLCVLRVVQLPQFDITLLVHIDFQYTKFSARGQAVCNFFCLLGSPRGQAASCLLYFTFLAGPLAVPRFEKIFRSYMSVYCAVSSEAE